MLALTSPTLNNERLQARLARARRCTSQLFWSVLETACPRSAKLGDCADACAIRRFVEAEAWTDAALTLVKLEVPLWTVRRLQLDGGKWHCALSQHRDLPEWLDNAKEAHHADLALAILSALVEASAIVERRPAAQPSDSEPAASVALCCENFS